MKRKILITVALMLVIAAVGICFVACDDKTNKENGVDLTQYNEIIERLDSAGYSVTADTDASGADMVATGQFAEFADMDVSWSIYGYKKAEGATAIPDMICIVCFASEEDAMTYEQVMVDMVNEQFAAQGTDIRFDSLDAYLAYFRENDIPLPVVYEMRGNCFVYSTGTGAADAFGE